MLWTFFWILAALVLLFAFVLLFGAPYLPTLKKQSDAALDLLDLKPGQTLLELGCGDGRVLKVAAKQGLNAIGYELNPVLVAISLLNTWKYRKQVKIVWGNFWTKEWPKADGIFVFLHTRFMSKLDKKIKKYKHKPLKVISYTYKIPSKNYLKRGQGLYLYKYR